MRWRRRRLVAGVSRGAGRHPSVGGVCAPHQSRRDRQSGSTAYAIQQRAYGSRAGLRRRPVRSTDCPRLVRLPAGFHARTPRPDRHPSAHRCNPRSVLSRRVQPAKVHTGSPVSRFLSSLVRNELIEVEWCRLATSFTSDECLAQGAQAGLAILKQPQSSTHDVAGRAVTARGDLLLDERAVVLIEAERRVLTHAPEDTNYWYLRIRLGGDRLDFTSLHCLLGRGPSPLTPALLDGDDSIFTGNFDKPALTNGTPASPPGPTPTQRPAEGPRPFDTDAT